MMAAVLRLCYFKKESGAHEPGFAAACAGALKSLTADVTSTRRGFLTCAGAVHIKGFMILDLFSSLRVNLKKFLQKNLTNLKY
jgi:hypothetical protein